MNNLPTAEDNFESDVHLLLATTSVAPLPGNSFSNFLWKPLFPVLVHAFCTEVTLRQRRAGSYAGQAEPRILSLWRQADLGAGLGLDLSL